MFGRIVEFTPKPEMKDEIVNVLSKEVLPILKKQQGFMEFLPFVPETKTEKWITVTVWGREAGCRPLGDRRVSPCGRNRQTLSGRPGHLQSLQRGNLPLPALRRSPDGLRSDTSGRNSPLVLLATNDARILLGFSIVIELVSSTAGSL